MPPLWTDCPAILAATDWPLRPGPGRTGSGWRRGLRFALVLAGHGALLGVGLELTARPEARALVREISVRLLETPPAAPADTPPPKPAPKPNPTRAAPPPTASSPTAPPILTAAPEAPAPSAAFTVAPAPAAAPAEPAADAAPPAPVSAARFDADYLANPKPAYPPSSRRLGEEGKVLLRIHVGADGNPLAVELKQSSGFDRLDAAARAAVERWRFVPAKRGRDAIDSWVTVPIVFSLQTP